MRVVLMAVLLLLAVPTARAESIEEEVRRHLDWIAGNTDLAYAGQPLPQVVVVAEETLANLVGVGAIGTYEVESNTILLVEGMPEAERESTLVHELVHYLQALGGRDDRTTCAGLLEPEAYRIEEAWLAAHGHGALEYDAFQVIMGVSACRMRGVHE